MNELHYLTRDHLGSVDSVTTSAGAVEVRLSYGVFGQRRREAGWTGNPTAGDWSEIEDATRRGFTTHEALDNLTLVHMNGRVYDPVVGRFLSADPFVQAPGFTQSFNRYSYVWNNPLSLTDPSGFQAYEDKKVVSWIDVPRGPPLIDLFDRFDYARDDRRIDVPPLIPSGEAPPEPAPPQPDPEHPDASVVSCPGDFMPCGTEANDITGEAAAADEIAAIADAVFVRANRRVYASPLSLAQQIRLQVYAAHVRAIRRYDPNFAEAKDPNYVPTNSELARITAYRQLLEREGRPAPSLPPFSPGGRTVGVLRTPSGDLSLQSGWAGPALSVSRGTSGYDIVTRTHVEGHAAAVMRQQGIREATLYINNPNVCTSCDNLLPRMLPAGSHLNVVTPTGSTTYVGAGH